LDKVAEVKPDGMTGTTSSLKGRTGAGGGVGRGVVKRGTKGRTVVETKSTAALARLLKNEDGFSSSGLLASALSGIEAKAEKGCLGL